MIKKHTFELKSRNNGSLWDSFAQAYQYFKEHKEKISDSFKEATFDKNFDEPMNYLVLECDERNKSQIKELEAYQQKFNDLFSENDKDIVVSINITNMGKFKTSIGISHTWFIKEDIKG